jgi:hypothetical protein
MAIERRIITDEAEWLAWRQEDITASVVAALWNEHPYETIYGLAAQRMGLHLSEPRSSPIMSRGLEFQEVCGRYLRRDHPSWKIRPGNVYLRDPVARLGCTPDFFCTTEDKRKGIIEAKTVASIAFRRTWTDGVPRWIALQALTCAMLARADFGLVAALVVDPWHWPPELHEYMVPRHSDAEKVIYQGVRNFWAALERKEMPSPDFTRDGALIAAMNPHATPGKTVDLSGDNRMPELLAEYTKLKAEHSELEKKVKALAAEAKEKIGDAEIVIGVPGWTRVTCKEVQVKEKIVPPYSYRLLRATPDKETEAESEAAE